MIKIEFTEDMLGTEVKVIANKNAEQRGFEPGKIYEGRLNGERDWLVGCPIFECELGKLGLNYECDLI